MSSCQICGHGIIRIEQFSPWRCLSEGVHAKHISGAEVMARPVLPLEPRCVHHSAKCCVILLQKARAPLVHSLRATAPGLRFPPPRVFSSFSRISLQGLPAVLHAFKRSGPTLTFLGAFADCGAQGIEGDRGVGGHTSIDSCLQY